MTVGQRRLDQGPRGCRSVLQPAEVGAWRASEGTDKGGERFKELGERRRLKN